MYSTRRKGDAQLTKQEAFDWIREAARNKTSWSDVQAFLMKLPPDDLKYVVGQMMRRCGYDLVD